MKKIKSLLIQNKEKEEANLGEPEREKGKNSVQTKKASQTSGMGEKNNDRIRVRMRRYKIKRLMLQPRNVDVKQNRRVVRRMVV